LQALAPDSFQIHGVKLHWGAKPITHMQTCRQTHTQTHTHTHTHTYTHTVTHTRAHTHTLYQSCGTGYTFRCCDNRQSIYCTRCFHMTTPLSPIPQKDLPACEREERG